MKVTKMLQRAMSLLLAVAMLLSFPAGVFSEGAGSKSKEDLEIPEGYVWRTLSVELESFEEDCAETEEEEAARLEEKAQEADRILDLMLSRSAEVDEEASEPAITVVGWMPEDITARAELISYNEKDLYAERALMQAEIRFYDGEGQSWSPALPVSVRIEGDTLEAAKDAKMAPTVYVYEELPQELVERKNPDEPEKRVFSVEAFSGARSADEHKEYELEGEDRKAEVNEQALLAMEDTPDAVCFETENASVSFVLTARQPDRSFSAASEDGELKAAFAGKLPRDLSAAISSATVEADAGLPGEVLMAWNLSMSHPDAESYEPEGTVKVALHDAALAKTLEGDWDLQLWQLREGAEPVRVQNIKLSSDELRFSAEGLSTFALVKVAVERRLTASNANDYSVRVSYDSLAGIPANAELVVRELLPEDEGYTQYLLQGAMRLGQKPSNLEFARVFDITLRDPETGAEYQPDKNVDVSVELLSENLEECSKVGVIHFGQQTELMGSSVSGDAVNFETSGFSVYVLMGVSIERIITAADGSTYEISVSYDRSSGIPAGAELEVRELTGAECQEYLTKTAEFLSRDVEQLVYSRFFDITIVKDGQSYEPNDEVSVSVRLLNRPETQGVLRVVHFGEQTELLENTETEDGCLEFNTASFSIYAITDEDGDVINPRVFYRLYDGDFDRGQQIVKNGDYLTEPQHEEVMNGRPFVGWFIRNGDEWGEQVFMDTPIQVVVGQDEETKVFGNTVVIPHKKDANGDWINHVDVTIMARYTSDYGVIKLMNRDNRTVKSSIPVPMPFKEDGSSADSAEFIMPDLTDTENNANYIGQAVPAGKKGYIFVGWSTETAKDRYGRENEDAYFSDYDKRTVVSSVTVENKSPKHAEVPLYPVYRKAHWLIFKSSLEGAGAEYVAPVFILNDQTVKASDKPADPKWRGHKFMYWTTEKWDEDGSYSSKPNGPKEFTFDGKTKLTADTVLYAYWEDGYTNYTVIYWQQKVTDLWNAPAKNRQYEIAGLDVRDAPMNTPVSLQAGDTVEDKYHGFHHKKDQDPDLHGFVDTSGSVPADPSGKTVLNVYYDRNVMYMQFSDEKPDEGYDDPCWNDADSRVETYIGLYGQKLKDNVGLKWPKGTWNYYSGPGDKDGNSGMSYLGQFVFPEDVKGNYFRAYQRTEFSGVTVDFFLQKTGGGWPERPDDNGYLENGGTFTFTDKYDGFSVYQYRRYYVYKGKKYYLDENGREVSYTSADEEKDVAWADAKVNETTSLSAVTKNTNDPNDIYWYVITGYNYYSGWNASYYDGVRYTFDRTEPIYWGEPGYPVVYFKSNGQKVETTYYGIKEVPFDDNGGTQYGLLNGKYYRLNTDTKALRLRVNLQIRYARRTYRISFYDGMDAEPLRVMLKNGNVYAKTPAILYQADIAKYYPEAETSDSAYAPLAKETGWVFSGRWYSDREMTTQIFFKDVLTDDDLNKLNYYKDKNTGEKIYINRPITAADLNSEDKTFGSDDYETLDTMPNRDLFLYAGFEHPWFWIKLDPNGGYLNGNSSDPNTAMEFTYFKEQYGKQLTEYVPGRTFVPDEDGPYYYHCDEYNVELDEDDENQPKHFLAYYTKDASLSTDGGVHYREANTANDEGYLFIGWYLVDNSEPGNERLKRFNFESTTITGNTLLRAMWCEKGDYRVYYSLKKVLDPNGNPVTGLTVTGIAPEDHDTYSYDSMIMVQPDDPNHPIQAKDSTGKEYEFLGWYYDNGIYAPFDVFQASPYLAERHPESASDPEAPFDTYILYPVFQVSNNGGDDTTSTMLTLDANGGYATPGYNLPEEAEFNADKTQVYFLKNNIPLNMDFELLPPVQLPASQNEVNVFSKDKAEFLGWAFSKNAKTPAFTAGQLVGVNNEDGHGYDGQNGNKLYAVWRRTEITVRLRLLDGKTNAAIPGGSFTLTDSENKPVPGTVGGIVSGTDGYLANGTVSQFNIKTPAIPGTKMTTLLTEIETVSGYVPLEVPVVIEVDYDGNAKYHLQGDSKEEVAQNGLIVIKEYQAICKVENGGVEKLFATLRDAVNYAKSIPDTTSTIQMMKDYAMPSSDFVTIAPEDHIALTTASKTGKNPYTGSGTVATITRDASGSSMFTVDGGEFTTHGIILDGGSGSSKTCTTDGGIISVKNGGSLTVETGTVLQNSNVWSNTAAESSGGAIAASGSGTKVVISGTENDPVLINGCSAKHSGGAVYVTDGAMLTAENAVVSACHAFATDHSGSYGGGAIAVVNGSNNPANPDAVLNNVELNDNQSNGIGGALLVYDAAVNVQNSTVGGTGSDEGNAAVNGGGIAAASNAHVTLSGTEIYGGSAVSKGGAMYVTGSVVEMADCTVIGNSAETGAGIYVDGDAKLQLHDAPNFGGAGVNEDGTLNNAVGNHSTDTLTDQTNGLAEYTSPRQDIYLAETGKNPASLVILGQLEGEPGSMWIWPEHENHYMMVKPFAVIDPSVELTEDSYKVFRNAREDDVTNCSGDYLTGQAGKPGFEMYVYWTGGVDVSFRKVDGFGKPLSGAVFGLYSDPACTSKVERKGEQITATSEDGVVTFKMISTGVYYMREVDVPNGVELSNEIYVLLVGEDYVLIPEEGSDHEAAEIWSSELMSDITPDDVNAQLEFYHDSFDLFDYVIFMVDSETDKAVTVPNIGKDGIMNHSKLMIPVILSKINTQLKPLPDAIFKLYSFDGMEIGQDLDGDGVKDYEFSSDATGVFFVGRLPLGLYYVEEVKAPEGYHRPEYYLMFQVTEEGIKTLKQNNDGSTSFELSNTITEVKDAAYELPENP